MSNNEVVSLDKFFIDPLCNGTITISSSVAEVVDTVDYPESNNTAAECSASYGTAITITPGGLFEFDFDSTTTSYGDNLGILKYIPAFYSSGSIVINAIVQESDDEDGAVDLTFDAMMYVADADKPTWYPYSLELVTDPDDVTLERMPYPMDGMITSPNDNTKHDSIGENTNLTHTFTIGSWVGMRPMVESFNTDGIKRGHLPPLSFKVTCKNNLESSVTFSSLKVSISFNYASDGTLMNLGSTAVADFCKLYCDPKFINNDEKTDPSDGEDRYLWAIADGYSKGEILHVFGYYRQTQSDSTTKLKCVYLKKVAATEGTNHAAFVYKSDIAVNPVDFSDNYRMVFRGFYSDEYAYVVTPKVICQSDKFKDISVTCMKEVISDDEEADTSYIECSPSDVDAIFMIVVKLRDDDIDEIAIVGTRLGVTSDDFNSAIKTIKFYDVDTAFVPYTENEDGTNTAIQVLRSDINKIFYDTLAKSFEEDVILVSSFNDVIPYVELKINSYADYIFPLYDGKSITFNESLSRCTDGVRSRELFILLRRHPVYLIRLLCRIQISDILLRYK